MLADLMTEETLEALAGERAFERGTDYFADGTVVGLKEVGGTITARVRGTYYYRVKLSAAAEGLAFECECPVGQDRVFLSTVSRSVWLGLRSKGILAALLDGSSSAR